MMASVAEGDTSNELKEHPDGNSVNPNVDDSFNSVLDIDNDGVGSIEKSGIEQQLQMRFEEAMQRRIDRRNHKDVAQPVLPSSGTGLDKLSEEVIPKVELQNKILQTTAENKKPTDGERDFSYKRKPSRKSATTTSNQYTRESSSNDGRDEYTWENPLTDAYGEYKEHIEYEDPVASRSKRACEWETYRSTSILFPPLPSGRPKAILHFVGGTFFGSYPRKFYGSLLEDIAIQCEAVVVSTPIPVILPGNSLMNRFEQWVFDEGGNRDNEVESNPLDHVYLAEYVQREFNNAYRDVILDEYFGDYLDDSAVESFIQKTPIVGVGHSLGARIQAVSCSNPNVSNKYLSMGKGRRLIRSGRDSMIYLGFANWGASSSIPGLEQLERTVKKRESTKKTNQSRNRRSRDGVGRQDDVWAERSKRRRRSDGYDQQMRRRYSRYERDDVDDLDISDIFSDVITSVAKGVNEISEAVTPDSNSLEFYPTPEELWNDLSPLTSDVYGKACRNNLIIQFDQDPIDQGSRLARMLISTSETDEDTNLLPSDTKFARLSGGHLTPVTFQDGIAKFLPKSAMSLFSSSYNFILQQFDDERTGKSIDRQRQEAKDVANTVASYITSLTKSSKR